MTWLILGMLLFYGTHLVSATPIKARAQHRLGAAGYRSLYSLLSLAGLLLMVWGFGQATGGSPRWQLPAGTRHLAMLLIALGLFSLVGSQWRSNWRRWVPDPMAVGLVLFGSGHLLVNSRPRDLLLFGGLALYGLFNIWSSRRRKGRSRTARQPHWRDVVHLILWLLLVTGILVWAHPALFGVAVL